MSDFDEDLLIPADDDAPVEDELSPLGPHAIRLPMQYIQGQAPNPQREARDQRRALEDLKDPSGGVFTDLVSTQTGDRLGGLRRTGRRIGRAAEDISTDPVDFFFGGAEGATANWLDELTGAAAALGQMGSVSGMPGSLDDYSSDPSETYGMVRDEVREAEHRARERSPYGFGAGEITGTLATAPLAAEEAAPTALGRLAQATRGGALYGGLASSGASEGEGDELLADTGEGVFGGAAAGTVAGLGGEALRGPSAAASREFQALIDRLRGRADGARVRAAYGPMREELRQIASSSPGGMSGEAERIRGMGLTGVARTPEEIAAAAEQHIEEAGTTEASRAERARHAASPETPFDLGALEGEFGDLAADASAQARRAAEERLTTAGRVRDLSQRTAARARARGGLGREIAGSIPVVGPAARVALSGRLPSVSATGLDALRGILDAGGAGLGRFAPALRAAAERGPGALAATHDVLSRTDPEYRSVLEEAAQPEERPLTPFEAGLIAADESADSR